MAITPKPMIDPAKAGRCLTETVGIWQGDVGVVVHGLAAVGMFEDGDDGAPLVVLERAWI